MEHTECPTQFFLLAWQATQIMSDSKMALMPKDIYTHGLKKAFAFLQRDISGENGFQRGKTICILCITKPLGLNYSWNSGSAEVNVKSLTISIGSGRYIFSSYHLTHRRTLMSLVNQKMTDRLYLCHTGHVYMRHCTLA